MVLVRFAGGTSSPMGLAFGGYPKELRIQKLITSPQEVLGSIGLM
jgi:hypothetical protein